MKIEKDSEVFFTEKYLSNLFKKIRPNENGTITYKRLQDFMQHKDDTVLPERIRNVIEKEAELKGDDEMNLNDFMEFINNEKYSNRFQKYLNIYMKFLIPSPQPSLIPDKKQEKISKPTTKIAKLEEYEEYPRGIQPQKLRDKHKLRGGFVPSDLHQVKVQPFSEFVVIKQAEKLFHDDESKLAEAKRLSYPLPMEPDEKFETTARMAFAPSSPEDFIQQTGEDAVPLARGFTAPRRRLQQVDIDDDEIEGIIEVNNQMDVEIIQQLRKKERGYIESSSEDDHSEYSILGDYEISLEKLEESRERIYYFWPLPLAMILISLSEIILYVIDAARGSNWSNGIIANQLIYNPKRRVEIWRYFSYMFVHSGTWHLSMNVIFQLMLGCPLEIHYNWMPITIIYLSGVISGALGSSVTNGYALLAGASGGVYALLTAHIVSIIMNWRIINHRKYLLIFLLTFIFIDILRIVIGYLSNNLDNSISHAAHYFGALSGILIGTTFFIQNASKNKRRKLTCIFLIVFVTLIVSAVFYNIFSIHTFPKQVI